MRLNYLVLWIENDPVWANSLKRDVCRIIEAIGLTPQLTIVPSDYNAVHFGGYDLIIMDMKLAGGKMGHQLIQDIRQDNIYTDVIFYSASGVATVKKEAQKIGLEGVYFTDRGKALFLRKIEDVINASTLVFHDLVNLRGFVMAEVSELDVKMDIIILKYYNTPERLDSFHKHITKDREDSIKKSLEAKDGVCKKSCTLSWRLKKIEEIYKKLESSQKAHAIDVIYNELIDTGRLPLEYKDKKFFVNYDADILKMRNNLAHCREDKNVNGDPILKTRNDGDQCFDKDAMIGIRMKIRYYNDLFDIIDNAVDCAL